MSVSLIFLVPGLHGSIVISAASRALAWCIITNTYYQPPQLASRLALKCFEEWVVGVCDEMGWVHIFPFTCQSGVNVHKAQSCVSCVCVCVADVSNASALQENQVSGEGTLEEDVNLSPLIPLEGLNLVGEDGRGRGYKVKRLYGHCAISPRGKQTLNSSRRHKVWVLSQSATKKVF